MTERTNPFAHRSSASDRTNPFAPSAAGQNLRVMSRSSPELASRRRRLSDLLGVSPVSLGGKEDRIEGELRSVQTERQLKDAPTTSRFLSDPLNAEVASDDVERLSFLESLGNGLRRFGFRARQGLAQAEAERNLQRAEDAERSLGEIFTDVRGPNAGLVPGPQQLLSTITRFAGSRLDDSASEEAQAALQRVGELQARIAATPFSEEAARARDAIIAAGQVEGIPGALRAAIDDPLGTARLSVELGAESLPQIGVAVGATALAGPAAGAITLGIASGVTERFSSPAEFLSKQGIDLTDPEQAVAALNDPNLMEQARSHGFTRGSIIGAFDAASGGLASKAFGGVITNFVAQTAIQSTLGGAGEAAAQLATEGEIDAGEVVLEAIGELATTPVEVVGVGGQYVRNVRKAARAKQASEVLGQMSDAAQSSRVNQRLPEVAAQHRAEVLKENGVEAVSVPVEPLNIFLRTRTDETAKLILGELESDIAQAQALGGDVDLTVEQLGLLQGRQDFSQIQPHIRMAPEEMTAFEADEFIANGLQDEVARVISKAQAEPVADQAQDPGVSAVQRVLGQLALGDTAQQLGMTKKQFEAYRSALEGAAKEADRERAKQQARDANRMQTKAWKEEAAQIRKQVGPEIARQAVYTATAQVSGNTMDKNATVKALRASPSQADLIATMHGFTDGQEMTKAIEEAPDFETAVSEEVDNRQRRKNNVTTDTDKAIMAVHNRKTAEAMALEANALRPKALPRVRTAQLRAFAREQLEQTPVGNLQPRKFLAAESRFAIETGIRLRRGDRNGAADASFKRVVNHHMADQAVKAKVEAKEVQSRLSKYSQKDFLKKQQAKIGEDNVEQIKSLLADLSLRPRLSNEKRARLTLQSWADQNSTQVPFELIEGDKTNWRDLTFSEFKALDETVSTIEKIGRDANKMRRAEEKRSLDEVVGVVADSVRKNLKDKAKKSIDASWLQVQSQNVSRNYLSYLVNPNTILRTIDGFEDLGPVFRAIKLPIDRAISEVWQPRQAREAQRQKELLDTAYGSEKPGFLSKFVEVTGSKPVKKRTTLAIALNVGNADNRKALVDSGQFTEEQLQAVLDTLDERDWRYVQSVWEYLDSFFPEIKAAQRKRVGFSPEKVVATPVQTKFGEFRGGYYPLKYDASLSTLAQEDTVEAIATRMRSGRFATKHTKRGHTKERKGSKGRAVRLDLNVISQHVDEVTYDLSLGDALFDVNRVINHKAVREAFDQTGNQASLEQLRLWVEDVTAGETGPLGLDKLARRIRTNVTVSRLAFNVVTAMLQPLGILQTSVKLGKRNTLRGLRKFMQLTLVERENVYKMVDAQSDFMRERTGVFNRDLRDARKMIHGGWLKSGVGKVAGKGAGQLSIKFFDGAGFFLLAKMQRQVDVVTWLAAQQKGLDQGMSLIDANLFADQTVKEAQASSNLADRSAFERGTASPKVRQSEWVKLFTIFSSYFIAKNNVALERYRKTNFRNPLEVVNLATDMVLLFSLEAMLAVAIRGQFDDDDELEDFAVTGAIEGLATVAAGFPVIREAVSAAQGFAGGGAVGSWSNDIGRLGNQIAQGDADGALLRAFISTVGSLLGTPSSQVNRTLRAIEEDGDAVELLIGPRDN